MADKKLNEVTKVTDMAYVPVIMSDGSIGQIAKADLASVVAEQNRNNNIKIIRVEDDTSLKTGFTKGGLYKWMFTSKDYTIPLFFIFTDSLSDYGIKILNETWYSKNVYLSIDSNTRELVIRYTGGTTTVYLEFVG